MLDKEQVRLHTIVARVKSLESLEKKCNARTVPYDFLTDITDLVGIRVITYFEEDINLIANLIEREFFVDHSRSVDKKALLDADRFGYLSLHYIVSLGSERTKLSEYQDFEGILAEIQVRSILQHAWAEIEHDLGYKNEVSVPKPIRRQFSRLAGLLELADSEFSKIRKELAHYRQELSESSLEQTEPIELDKESLEHFIYYDKLAHQIDQEIAEIADAQLKDVEDSQINSDVEALRRHGITDIEHLRNLLLEYRPLILKYADAVLRNRGGVITASVCILYLFYVMIGKENDLKKMEDFLHDQQLGQAAQRYQIASEILSILQKAVLPPP